MILQIVILILPALLIDVKHSKTMVFKSKASALLPWYSMANSPETYSNETFALGSVRPSLKDENIILIALTIWVSDF